MIKFILKESVRPFRKAAGSFLISLITVSISIFLVTLSYYLYDISGAVQKKLKNTITLNVFLNDSLQLPQISSIAEAIGSLAFIDSSFYISKEQAAEIFVNETGEDFRKILEYNPLPASFRVKIKENYISASFLKGAVQELSSIKGVDEAVYEDQAAGKVLTFINETKTYVLWISVLLVLISVYIIYSTSRLILRIRKAEMETMKLIGAKISAIKMPVVLNALLTGMLAGIISFTFFSLFIKGIEDYIYTLFSYKFKYFYLLSVTIITGPVLGVIISLITLRKISLKI